MRKFIKEYLNIIAFTAIGLVLVVSSFYLIMNYYHSEEVKQPIYISSGDINYQNYTSKLSEINNNLTKFKTKNSKNTAYKTMYNKLLTCQTVMSGEGTLAKIPVNSYFNSKDLYDLGSKFQSEVLNVCWALHLSYITNTTNTEFSNLAPHVQNSIDLVTSQINFALTEIQNNSSYFYTTGTTSATIRNYLSADYEIIAKSYNEFADIILELSKTINQENGGIVND